MKKYLFFAAAVAITACTNDTLIDDTKVPDTKEVAIGFATGTNNLTRAENSSATKTSALETYHQNFSVWGYKNIKDGSTTPATLKATKVFDGTIANGTALSGQIAWDEDASATTPAPDWKYAPTRYWDKAATDYDFYAAAPTTFNSNSVAWTLKEYAPESGTATVEQLKAEHGRYFTLTDVEIKGESLPLATTTDADKKVTGQTDDVFGKGTKKDDDLMIATNIISYKNYTKDRVHFFFNHILSRLNIGVKTTVESTTADPQTLVLNEVKVYNMYSKGNFDESKAGTTTNPKLADGTVNRWVDATSGSESPSQQTIVFGFPNDEVKLKNSTDKFDIAKELTYTKGTGTSSTDETAAWADYKLVYQGLVIPQTVKYDGALKLDGSNAVPADATATDVSEPYLYIKYTLNDEIYESYYNLAALFNGSMLAYKNANGFLAYKSIWDDLYLFEKSTGGYELEDGTAVNYGFKDGDKFYGPDKQEIYYNPSDTKYYATFDGTTYSNILATQPEYWVYWNEYHNTVPVTNAEAKAEGYDANVDFCEGWQNNLWITINPTSIQFDADVYEWSTKWDSGVTVE